MAQLEETFRQRFGFQTMTFSIPETYAERETMECVSQFFAGAKNSDLLVLYYAGHAIQNPFTLVRYICPIIHDVERDRTNLHPPPQHDSEEYPDPLGANSYTPAPRLLPRNGFSTCILSNKGSLPFIPLFQLVTD